MSLTITARASTVDLFDETSGQRIVCRVQVAGRLAVRITLHDVACRDRPSCERASAAIVGTVRRDRAGD